MSTFVEAPRRRKPVSWWKIIAVGASVGVLTGFLSAAGTWYALGPRSLTGDEKALYEEYIKAAENEDRRLEKTRQERLALEAQMLRMLDSANE